MTVLAIKTDTSFVDAYLLVDDGIIDEIHEDLQRMMALKLPEVIEQFLTRNTTNLNKIDGLICHGGPGSFTSLRIGHTYANTLAYALEIPIVQSMDESWLQDGVNKLSNGANEKVLTPKYGKEAHITESKK